MRTIFSLLILVIVITMLDSCKKKGSDLSSTPSQLWLKVSNDVPEFSIDFIGKDSKNQLKNYFVTYTNNELSPNLKTATDNINNETWVMVFKSLDKTDQITLQLSGESNTYKAKGFGYGEKRFVEISRKSSGSINVSDRDITTINVIVYVE